MGSDSTPYLMEHAEETFRLELKTDPAVIREQALWCGVRPGLRLMDAGCGPGKTTSILHGMVQPGGEVVGVDASEERIRYAEERYGGEEGISFLVHDWSDALEGVAPFDLVWVRFLLEYNRKESFRMLENMSACLRPGGSMCLMDLDHNCMSHHELDPALEAAISELMACLEREHDFDPYAGRKLYTYLYDLGYEDIRVDLRAHHLFYGSLQEVDAYNWIKKLEVASAKTLKVLERYPGGRDRFMTDFTAFLAHPRRFSYTPMILTRGIKPASS